MSLEQMEINQSVQGREPRNVELERTLNRIKQQKVKRGSMTRKSTFNTSGKIRESVHTNRGSQNKSPGGDYVDLEEYKDDDNRTEEDSSIEGIENKLSKIRNTDQFNQRIKDKLEIFA